MKGKKFPCGHQGKGQFCHRCQQAEILLAAAEDKKKYQALGKRMNYEEAKPLLQKEAARLKAIPQKNPSL